MMTLKQWEDIKLQEPRNVEHEQLVLAGMMNNDECFYDALAELDVEFFSDVNTKSIFGKIAESNKRMTANMLSKNAKEPREKSAIRTYDGVWSNKDEFYHSLQGLKETYLKRQLYQTLNKVTNRFDDAEFADLVSSIDQDINSFYFDDNGENIIDPKERAPISLLEFWEILDNPDKAKGIPYSVTNQNGVSSGFPSLDRSLNGAHPGDLIMIAAKTGVGKTGFALNLARLFSFKQNFRGYYMNTEMRIREMEARLLAPIANVKANEILYGQLEGSSTEIDQKKTRISDAFNQYMQSSLIMSRIPDLPLHKAKGLAKQVRSKFKKLDYIIVDYVGRMEIVGFDRNIWDELYEITKEMKKLAITLNIPIFILAQRNQAGDVEGAKKMMNECDGVLYFEPTTSDDLEYIERDLRSDKVHQVNYKIIKKKVRRDDNSSPIYVKYDKARNFVNEVM